MPIRAVAMGCVVVGLSAGLASADVLSTKSRAKLFKNQTHILDTRAASQYSNSVRLQPAPLDIPSKYGRTPRYDGRYNGEYATLAREAARRHGVPEDLFLRLVQQESNWQVAAVSSKGAIGLAQLMPGTAQLLRVDPHDPEENLEGGARYLMMQYRAFRSWKLALAAYNAGPEAVREHGGVPPYAETRDYVKRILGD